jgi:uncharacterized protein (DUF983 family)
VYFIFAKKTMLGKGTKLYSILRLKCPRCHEGDFYKGSPFKFATMGRVKENCSECNLKYNIEPSFFQGSYYVAYALGVSLFITVWILQLIFFPNIGPGTLLISILVALLVFSPILYALSKIIWINVFVKYEASILKKKTSNDK